MDYTFADRLIQLRKERSLSQEQLADLLGVTRQSVSKWESGASMPDTEKLVALAREFGVSVDYLLRPEVQREPQPAAVENAQVEQRLSGLEKMLYTSVCSEGYEYKSKAHIGNLPLVHIRFGNGRRLALAKGVIAIGNVAVGVVALGAISMGVFAFGGLALGLLALGAAVVGGVVLGGAALGVVAIGGIAVGVYALGGGAFALRVAVGDDALSALFAASRNGGLPVGSEQLQALRGIDRFFATLFMHSF